MIHRSYMKDCHFKIRFVLERQNQNTSKTTKTDFCLSAVTSSSSSCSAIHTEMPTCLAYAILQVSRYTSWFVNDPCSAFLFGSGH